MKDVAEIICILDRSGSMGSIRRDAIGGFNSFIESQKLIDGEARVTLILFDHEYKIVYENINLKKVLLLSESTFIPRGSTALFDAIGKTIDGVGKRLESISESDRPSKVIVTILTDGEENSSHSYSKDQIASMIKHQEEKYGWEFIFIAANQDAFATGSLLNIKASNAMTFQANSVGTTDAYNYMSRTVGSYRASK